MAEWPESLPCLPLPGTFSFQTVPNLAEFKPEIAGVPPIRRRRYTVAGITYRGTMRLVGAQVETLKTFYSDELLDGVMTFTMRDWRKAFTSGTDEDGEFQMLEEPAYSHQGANRFDVALVVAKVD